MLKKVFDEDGNHVAWALAFKPDELDRVPQAIRNAFDAVATVDKDRLPCLLFVCVTLDELARISVGMDQDAAIGRLWGAFFREFMPSTATAATTHATPRPNPALWGTFRERVNRVWRHITRK